MADIITKKTLIPLGLVIVIAIAVSAAVLYFSSTDYKVIRAQETADTAMLGNAELAKSVKEYSDRVTSMEALLGAVSEDVKIIKSKLLRNYGLLDDGS